MMSNTKAREIRNGAVFEPSCYTKKQRQKEEKTRKEAKPTKKGKKGKRRNTMGSKNCSVANQAAQV